MLRALQTEFSILYGLTACSCNLMLAASNYIVGQLSNGKGDVDLSASPNNYDKTLYQKAWWYISILMCAGCAFSLALCATAPRQYLQREKSHSFGAVVEKQSSRQSLLPPGSVSVKRRHASHDGTTGMDVAEAIDDVLDKEDVASLKASMLRSSSRQFSQSQLV